MLFNMQFSRYDLTDVYQSLTASIHSNPLITGKNQFYNSTSLLDWVNTLVIAGFAFLSTRWNMSVLFITLSGIFLRNLAPTYFPIPSPA